MHLENTTRLYTPEVRLLMLDLDNTLVDRAAAFHRWAARYARALGGDEADIEWLIAQDADGYRPREELAASIAEHFGLNGTAQDTILEVLRAGLVEEMAVDPEVTAGLQRARSMGWTLVAVTNGTVMQQERKIRHLELDACLDGWVISEAVGIKKPDSLIFEIAAQQAGSSLNQAWMVGDHPTTDIWGAHAVGAFTCWVRRGRVWSQTTYRPTAEADDCATALSLILDLPEDE